MTEAAAKPGSPEAVDQDCLCPVLDNGHGAWGGIRKDGQPLFWLVVDCPLHGQRRSDLIKTETEQV